MQQTNAIHDRTVKSLGQFKARMCDCGNPICFGSFTSQDVAWLVQYAEKLQRKDRKARMAVSFEHKRE